MSFTPYAAAKMLTSILKENGIEKTIPTQMMYNYTTARIRQGKKPFIEVDGDGRIDEEAFQKWVKGYLSRKGIEVK